MDQATSKRGDTQRHLPPALQLHILSFLPPNDRTLSGRLVSPDAAAGLSGPQHCTASLSQPLPPHAAPWAVEAGQQHVRQLTFWHKLQLLCTAAASGSEVNLEVAWALLQPSIFPELVQDERYAYYKDERNPWGKEFLSSDPGVAAAKAGHLQLLPWLLRRCPGLLWPERVLEAAARYCDLEGLREALALLNTQRSGMRRKNEVINSIRGGRGGCGGRGGGRHVYSTSIAGPASALGQRLLEGAAQSDTPDAVQKLAEILGAYECCVTGVTQAAVRSGDLGRLRWLRDREGWDMRWAGSSVLHCALAESSLAVAQWLVEEGGCELPPAEGASTWEYRGSSWEAYMTAAARSADGVAKLQWLRERGATLPDHELLKVLSAAISAGHVDVARHVLSCLGPRLEGLQTSAPCLPWEWGSRAATSGSVAMAEFMRQAGAKFSGDAYIFAMEAASLPMVRWLVNEARRSLFR